MNATAQRRILKALALLVALCLAPCLASAQNPKKEYLTSLEADRIREAEQPSQRIKLFIEFAADRLKKFQYELARPTTERRRAERLNDLLNAYTGCVDDAANLIDLGREKQEDIRAGVKEMQKRVKEFLGVLEKLAAEGADLPMYKETLDDALEATRTAKEEVEKAAKEISPGPVRRKP